MDKEKLATRYIHVECVSTSQVHELNYELNVNQLCSIGLTLNRNQNIVLDNESIIANDKKYKRRVKNGVKTTLEW